MFTLLKQRQDSHLYLLFSSPTAPLKYLPGSLHSSVTSPWCLTCLEVYFSQPWTSEHVLSSLVCFNAKRKHLTSMIIIYHRKKWHFSIQDKCWISNSCLPEFACAEKLHTMKLSSSGAQQRLMVDKKNWSGANEPSLWSCCFKSM